jgi:hypothetical protein
VHAADSVLDHTKHAMELKDIEVRLALLEEAAPRSTGSER